MLGRIFIAYLENVITADELKRLWQAIHVAFMGDLLKFLDAKELPTESQESWMELLVPSGLVRVIGGKTIDEVGEIYYEVTPIGNKLRNAYSQVVTE
uniref:Uncharacterized protein n=1 Tax=Candidatus Kentrum sp. DK TaxID=2126562 RepID=A0A450RYW9_9GAMM|nr:MAG: hypothetical protein BECKDK2373C_GA0170839_100817 [Candidatus Kentron sp. DK]